jgi:hypothetical protein
MYLDFCMYFTRIPNESKIHFGIHIRYIRIYVNLARGIHAGYMRDTFEIHVSAEVRGYIEDTCGIHERYIMRYMYLNCIQRGTYLQMYLVVS